MLVHHTYYFRQHQMLPTAETFIQPACIFTIFYPWSGSVNRCLANRAKETEISVVLWEGLYVYVRSRCIS